MSIPSRCQLQTWLDEFRAAGLFTTGSIKVLEQDDVGDDHDGLIVVELTRAATVTYLQYDPDRASRWAATMEPREQTLEMDASELQQLSTELAVLSSLCAFLQHKSAERLDARA